VIAAQLANALRILAFGDANQIVKDMGEREVLAWNLSRQVVLARQDRETTMQLVTNECTNKFPTIHFRKKRLAVAIYAHFDIATAQDASVTKQMVEEAISRLRSDGHARVTYSVTDL
jgi:hypothetical protein